MYCYEMLCNVRTSKKKYSGTPLKGHPSGADTCDTTGNLQSPKCLPIRCNTLQPLKADATSRHGMIASSTVMREMSASVGVVLTKPFVFFSYPLN